jgi:hypothetical protein
MNVGYPEEFYMEVNTNDTSENGEVIGEQIRKSDEGIVVAKAVMMPERRPSR